ncbi:smg-4/UPF3 family protein [Colletotrichum abscissum]|uniref:Smg-4/UPF3 family protein n=1 Tax=Colletotrichum abscissum TaxID=1671311 RepID=A0A9P9XG05_9PEZI|nr:smg-4/UPF3 family protein [Colletotrichum abscissum]KAI3552961.1 smg-4/UPF3 family protein [Colletotrichum abscissum]KAK1496776.1 smg-4/UPF3 family protein [Colletotrichum abscissum]
MATSGAQGASRKTNGVLSVSGQQATTDAPKSNKSRTPVEGDKVVIRRLPPGMTEQELWNNLGDEWKAGNGLVSWHNFEAGKISHDPAKPSRPGRVYLHVLKRESLNTLSNLIQAKSWEDAKMTSNSASLVGPPVLEFAIYNKVPSSKKRTDPRQGTIDQDPEFMAFLQSLTNPEIDKDNESNENKDVEETKPETKVTTTPLIEFLKEKKANKQKEAAAAKSAKQARQDSSTKGKSSASTAEDSKKGKKDSKGDKSADKPKETVKILTKKATADAVKAAEAVANQITQASSSSSQDQPKSRRAGIAAAARILQRDLGISPGSAHRRARLDAAKAEADSKGTSSKEPAQPVVEAPAAAPPPVTAPAPASSAASQTSERNATPTAPKSGRSRRGGGGKNASANEAKGKSTEASGSSSAPAPAKAPVILLKKKDEEKNKERAAKVDKEASSLNSQPAAAPASAKSNAPTGPKASGKGSNAKKSTAAVTAGVTRGFVKHANPSQGVTEALLKQAMEAFGTVTFVEIDKRKGFAYVDFSDHDGLVKAVAASPIQVAQGTVQVLERKEKKPAASNSNSNANNSNSSNAANTAAASSSSAPPSTTNASNSNATPSEKPEHHKRTRRGRGGGKAAAAGASGSNSGNKDAARESGAPPAGTG